MTSDKKRVLIIEDNPLNMKLAADLLELNDFNVLKAEDGDKALRILETSVPDLIIMDIQLPGIDGFQLFEQIKKDMRLDKVKVVAVTALVMKEEVERIKDVGFSTYISKPIDTENFVETIKNLLFPLNDSK